MALSLLNEKYGITEKDFFRAEIEMVPAVKARDVGFDTSMIGAYGQDDRVCAYTALTAEIDAKKPAHTTVTILADKEEIGSTGNTGLNSDFVLHYIEDLAEQAGVSPREVLRKSLCRKGSRLSDRFCFLSIHIRLRSHLPCRKEFQPCRRNRGRLWQYHSCPP